MTEGGIAEWKIKEGEAFSAGDVLLEIVRPSLSMLRPASLTAATMTDANHGPFG